MGSNPVGGIPPSKSMPCNTGFIKRIYKVLLEIIREEANKRDLPLSAIIEERLDPCSAFRR